MLDRGRWNGGVKGARCEQEGDPGAGITRRILVEEDKIGWVDVDAGDGDDVEVQVESRSTAGRG